jgi:N-acyl homoserine lactone hydrolase
MNEVRVRRIDFGYFVRPPKETGTPDARVEPCLGYLVVHPEGVLLFDTGMGAHPDVDAHYRPWRRPLEAALDRAGARVSDVDVVANCHLHFDHCGGNPLMSGRPVLTQAIELEAARRTVDYTLPELIDPPGVRYEELSGEAEVFPGVMVIPTPGHTAGHQSLVVQRRDGTIVVAGQSHDNARDYGADVLARQARLNGSAALLPDTPSWLDRLLAFDPARVVFAHDNGVWEP